MTNNNRLITIIFKIFFLPILIFSSISSAVLLPLHDHIIPKNYSAKSQFLVTTTPELLNRNIDLSAKYISNYNLLMYSDSILSKVKKEAGFQNYSIDDLKKHLNIIYSEDSQIVTIQVITDNKNKSIKLANTILYVMRDEGPKLLPQNDISILGKAQRTDKLSTMPKKMYFIIVFCMFLVFYSLLIIYIFYVRQKVLLKIQIVDLLGSSNIYVL